MPDVRIAGAAVTRFGRRPEPMLALAREAAERALADAGGAAPDLVVLGTHGAMAAPGEANGAAALAADLGLAPAAATRVETASSSGASAVEHAWMAVASGLASRALVVGAESMTGAPRDEATARLAGMIAPAERALGLTMPALAALSARAYMRRYGLSRETLALVPVKAHAHGARNPDAHFRAPVTVEEVLASPPVADPLVTMDCAPRSDGAAALVLAAGEGPVRVAGVGHATDAHAVADRPYPDALTSFRATLVAAERAFRRAGLRREDVHVAEVHDAFSILELVALEDLGLFPAGEGAAALELEATSLGGRLPVNPSGGLKARGHPVGATGVAQVVEVFLQLARRAGARQVDGARVGVAQNVGGYGNNNVVTVLEAV